MNTTLNTIFKPFFPGDKVKCVDQFSLNVSSNRALSECTVEGIPSQLSEIRKKAFLEIQANFHIIESLRLKLDSCHERTSKVLNSVQPTSAPAESAGDGDKEELPAHWLHAPTTDLRPDDLLARHMAEWDSRVDHFFSGQSTVMCSRTGRCRLRKILHLVGEECQSALDFVAFTYKAFLFSEQTDAWREADLAVAGHTLRTFIRNGPLKSTFDTRHLFTCFRWMQKETFAASDVPYWQLCHRKAALLSLFRPLMEVGRVEDPTADPAIYSSLLVSLLAFFVLTPDLEPLPLGTTVYGDRIESDTRRVLHCLNEGGHMDDITVSSITVNHLFSLFIRVHSATSGLVTVRPLVEEHFDQLVSLFRCLVALFPVARVQSCLLLAFLRTLCLLTQPDLTYDPHGEKAFDLLALTPSSDLDQCISEAISSVEWRSVSVSILQQTVHFFNWFISKSGNFRPVSRPSISPTTDL